MQEVQNFFTSKYFIASLIIIGIAIFLVIFAKYIKEKWNGKLTKKGKTKYSVLVDILKVAIPIIVILAILQANGINISGLVAGFSVIGIIVAFAVEDLLKDIVMGVHIMNDNFFDIGDIIRYEDYEGRVVSFNLRVTKIELTINKELVIICNRNIDKISIAPKLCSIRVNLSYEDDHIMVGKILTKAAEKIAELEGVERARFAGTEEFLESSISYAIFFWCEDPADRYELHRQAMLIVQNVLKEEGIKIPYNQLDIHTFEHKN